MAEGFAFMPDALDANAAGRLTDAQRAMFKHGSWLMRWMPTLTGDLRRAEVRSIEGPIRKITDLDVAQSTTTSGMPRHALEVAGERFDVPSTSVWQAAPAAGYVRLYYLPRSRTAVNLERLPDPPVDSSPQAIIGTVTDAVASALRPAITRRGAARKAEKMAQANAVLNAAKGAAPEPVGTAAPPSEAALAEGIVGTWSSPFFTADVRADGTLSLHNALQSDSQGGRWRAGDDGRLYLRFDGDPDAEQPVAVTGLSGDRVSLQLGGQNITLERSA